MKIYISGKLLSQRDAKISVFDHGLLYGDGVFEGIRAYNGRVFMLDRHIDRLFESAQAIVLDIPMTKVGLTRAVIRTCKANQIRNGYIRLVVTRGVGTLGLNPYLCKKGEVIIIADRIQLYPKKLYEKGMAIVTVGTVRNHPEALNPRIKSLNYLNNIMAKIEAINSGVLEAVMLNVHGNVAEATGDNIFIVKNSVLVTPPKDAGILAGITRDVVIGLARDHGYEVHEQTLSRYDLYGADEVFLTGTAAEVIGVINIDRRKIGTGKPGTATRYLAREFRRLATATGDPIR